MTVRDELHQLIDQLDETVAYETLDYIRWLQHPYDMLTSQEWGRVREGEAQIDRGEYVMLDDLEREFGMSIKPCDRG